LAVQRLLKLVNEGHWDVKQQRWMAPPQQSQALNVQITSNTGDVHSVLLRQQNGYSLLLWREVESFDLQTKNLQNYPAAQVRVTLPTPVNASLWQLNGADAVVQRWAHTRVCDLAVPDEVVVLKFTQATSTAVSHAPAQPAAAVVTKSEGTAVLISWPTAKDAVAYIVSRFGSQLGTVIPAGPTATFSDSELLPAKRYPYDIQAVNRQGLLSPVRSITAPTTNAVCDVIITEVGMEPAHPKAGDAVKFYAMVKNIGETPTPAHIVVGVHFKLDDGFSAWSSQIQDSLQPGEIRRALVDGGPTPQITWTATAGKHTIEVIANDIHRFIESNFINNTTNTTIDITP
jgi:hypothetical protein